MNSICPMNFFRTTDATDTTIWKPGLKEVRVLVNALSVVKSFYFCTKISRLIQITKFVK